MKVDTPFAPDYLHCMDTEFLSGVSVGDAFKTLSHIEDGAFCEDRKACKPLTIFTKISILDV